ncbi:MAG: alpha/beta fold hydrolase, partial [Acidobacteriota bacterium]|nr:alpha/beta fold hydrolase [Acidobacteriota bacterium]
VLLLHGWPDTARLWDEVGPRLVDAGYRVATPDLRGCGRSSKPAATSDYAMHHLVADVAAVTDALGGPVALVGHDWGAALAWAVAAYLPERVTHLVALSVGHPTAFRSGGLDQQMRSWYTLLFSYEEVGELFLRYNDYEALRTWARHPRAEEVIAELERDGQISSHLRWYRANLPPDSFLRAAPVLPPITAPTLGVWSTRDFALGERQMSESARFCPNGFTYRVVEGAGHWLPLEVPEEVASEVVTFLARVT